MTAASPAPPVPPPTIGLNGFARRHTAQSRFSHFDGTEAELLAVVAACFTGAKDGKRDGVKTVVVPTRGFFSGVVAVSDRMGLEAHWVRRADGEDPYIEISAPDASKAPAASAAVIVYRRDLLLVGGKATTEADWEIVSINARADRGGVAGEEPQHPLSMARNHLNKPGGTAATYTADDYAKAIMYWARRVHVGTDPDRVPLTGPDFPPLRGAVVKADRCPDWVEAVCDDWTFLPEAAAPEPLRPMTLALRAARLRTGRVPEDGLEWAKSVYYWSSRPRRECDISLEM